MANIKLIITDLDNTLLKSDKTISQFTIDVINECKKRGILFGVATARSWWSAKRYTDIVKPDIIINSGGAVAKYKGEIIYESVLSAKTSNKVIKECLLNKDFGQIAVQTPHNYYRNSKEYFKLKNSNPDAIYHDFEEPFEHSTYKILVEVFNEEAVKEVLSKFEECSYISFRGEAWSRFAHKNASKINAIKSVMNYFNLSKDQVICFGDDTNDIGMIEYFGGVAVANAINEVKKVAGAITKSNDDDGVAYYIKENLLY